MSGRGSPTIAKVRIRRFDAERPSLPRETEHAVEVTPQKTVLAALLEIQARDDSTLSFRASCRHGACGSCTVEINGRPRLACTRLLKNEVDRRGHVAVGPMPGVGVTRDLVVDLAPFWKAYRDAKPWLARDEKRAPRREFRVRPEDMAAFEGADACILCAACWSACPVTRAGRFDGPHALLKTHLRVCDPRDEEPKERLRGVADDFGAFRCHGVLACASVCPKGIDVSEAVFALRASMTHAAAIAEERGKRREEVQGVAEDDRRAGLESGIVRVIRTAGGVALVVRRVSGILITVYFAMWLARLHVRPLAPFGGDLGRDGSATGKVLEMALIALLSVHAFEGLSQLLVERLHLWKQRAFLLTFAVLLGLAFGAVHFFWFFGGRIP